MKIKTSELKGAALDWAVMTLEKPKNSLEWFIKYHDRNTFAYSTSWQQGGEIIERKKIQILPYRAAWAAISITDNQTVGETPLIAAMRCYVASKLGDTVEIPDELINAQ